MKSSTNTSNTSETIRFRVRHVTHFSYDNAAYESHNEVRLKPRASERQRVIGFHLEVIPRAAIVEYNDAFGNAVHAISAHEPHRELRIFADSVVERRVAWDSIASDRFEDFLSGDAMRSQEEYDFLHASTYVPFSEPLKKFFWMVRPRMEEPVADYTHRIVAWICDQFAYEPGTTNVHSTVDHVLAAGAGVCQDFAHLSIGVLRLAGVPARYVSGYLAPRIAPGASRPVGEQASHAWIEALLPGHGWVGFDPTHGARTTSHHIRVAVGRDYGDVPPVRGVYRSYGSKQMMRVVLDINEVQQPETAPFDPGAQQQ